MNKPQIRKVLYRIHDTPTYCDFATSYSYCCVSETYLLEFEVLSITECGAWIKYGDGKKFVLLDARKKFACESVELAEKSFVARKTRQLKIMSRHMDAIRTACDAIANQKTEHKVGQEKMYYDI